MKGATWVSSCFSESLLVSIHAPVKGATKELIEKQGKAFVSIHAPVKGATKMCRSIRRQPDVSIHAPVKGATDGEAFHQTPV